MHLFAIPQYDKRINTHLIMVSTFHLTLVEKGRIFTKMLDPHKQPQTVQHKDPLTYFLHDTNAIQDVESQTQSMECKTTKKTCVSNLKH